MSVVTSEVNLLELAAEHQSVRRVFEGHGLAWLLDSTNPGQGAHFLQDAAAISGLAPADLQSEIDQAIENAVSRPMTRRLLWREPGP